MIKRGQEKAELLRETVCAIRYLMELNFLGELGKLIFLAGAASAFGQRQRWTR